MKTLIPSKDVRKLIKKSGREFSDFEKAVLIYNGELPYYKKLNMLKRLFESTKDSGLREMLEKRIAWDEEDIEEFVNNSTGYIYVLNLNKDCLEGCNSCFGDLNFVYLCGLESRHNFIIEKYPVACGNEKYSKSEERVAYIHYDINGEILDFSSCEVERDFDDKYDMYWNFNRFENAYIDIPNPFELGDIVNALPYNKHCLVATSHSEWKHYTETMKNTNEKDFTDGSIRVYYFLDDGLLCSGWINPILLERVELTQNDMDREVLCAARNLLKGGDFGCFAMCYGEYHDILRNREG